MKSVFVIISSESSRSGHGEGSRRLSTLEEFFFYETRNEATADLEQFRKRNYYASYDSKVIELIRK